MRKFLFAVVFIFLAFFSASLVKAQTTCVGESTGAAGTCRLTTLTCLPPAFFDGSGGCPGYLGYCCVGQLNETDPSENAFMCSSSCNTFEPNCATGFNLPSDCVPYPDPGWETCCADLYLDNFGICTAPQYTSCVLENPPPSCPSGQVCTGLDPGTCNLQGGNPQLCSGDEGVGSCCQDSGCPDNYYCEDLGPAGCSAGQGVQTGCYLTDGSTANCCLPGTAPALCQAGYDCEYVVGGEATCDINGGVSQSCTQNGSTGNCCIPGQGTYGCAWDGAACYTDLSGATFPYTCGANFGHCTVDDPTCTSCDDPILTRDECLGLNPNICIEQNETEGYYCGGTSVGCQPCFEWNSDPTSTQYIPSCDPPEYRGGTPEENYGTCNLACTGQVPTRYSCNNSQCIEDGSGPYEGLTECSASCGTSGNCVALDGTAGTCSFLLCNLFTEVPDHNNPQNPTCSSNPDINANYWCCKPKPEYTPLNFPEANPFYGCTPEYPSGGGFGGGIQSITPPNQCIINSAIGCIPVFDSTAFVAFIIRFSIGIGGGIALVLIAYAGITISTSTGNPYRLKSGKELLWAALTGLGLILGSAFILNLIGFEILRLPGF